MKPMAINLTVAAGTARFHYCFEQREVLVGRAETVDVRLPHPSVSQVHLCLRHHKGRLMVMDSGSTNGTTLDGVDLDPHEPQPVSPGSRIKLGIFALIIGQPEPGELTAPKDTAGFARRMVLEVLDRDRLPALVVQNGPGRGERLEIAAGGALVVGRDTACDLRLSDADASRRHLEVRLQDSAVQVRDLRSKNGVRVDGARLQGWRTLIHGTELKIGKTLLCFTDPAESYLQDLQRASDSAGVQGPAGRDDPRPGAMDGARQRLRRVDLALAAAAAALVLGAVGLILYLMG